MSTLRELIEDEKFAAALHRVITKPGRAFTVPESGPRVLTFTLDAGRELLVTVFNHGEITVAERETADHSISWGPPLRPTSDSAVPRG